jgi:predicted phage terminase large subunit-like protein
MDATFEIRPQPGRQEEFLKSAADICIYGGSAGGGKSFGLLLETCFHIANPGFRAVCFRRTVPMIKQPGGLWDTSTMVYPQIGAVANQSVLEWRFPSGATLKFSGLELEGDRFAWQGSQITLLMFDELAEFEESQFWFMVGRCRSTCGIKPYVRAGTNPVPDGWLRRFLDWWIGADGLPIRERSGTLRWFTRQGDELFWGDSKAELESRFGADCGGKSLTFIGASIHDNQILMRKDPDYISNLRSLSLVDRRRFLDGDWNARASAGAFFQRQWFPIEEAAPAEVVARVRFWDRAASERKPGTDPDATAGLLLSKDRAGVYRVEDVRHFWASAAKVEQAMLACASQDGPGVTIAYHQDPGSAGKGEAEAVGRALAGYVVKFTPATGDKQVRARPVSAQAEFGNIRIVRGPWLDSFLRELEAFPEGRHDDQVDALSGAFQFIAESSTGAFTAETVRQVSLGGGVPWLTPRVFVPRFWQHYDQTPITSRFSRERTPEERGIPVITPTTRAAI